MILDIVIIAFFTITKCEIYHKKRHEYLWLKRFSSERHSPQKSGDDITLCDRIAHKNPLWIRYYLEPHDNRE
jgi:hypothetical protein